MRQAQKSEGLSQEESLLLQKGKAVEYDVPRIPCAPDAFRFSIVSAEKIKRCQPKWIQTGNPYTGSPYPWG